MSICKPNCVTGLPNFGAINDCDVQSLLSSGEIAKVIFFKCSATFIDITDPDEWDQKIMAGDATIPFVGNGKIDEQTESGEYRVGCQTITSICKKPFEFISPITDADAQSEWSLYNDIQKQRLGLGVLFLTCDGILLINPDWVTLTSPTLKLSMLKISQIFSGEADGKMTYKINGEISECRSLKRVKLTQDVLDIINATI